MYTLRRTSVSRRDFTGPFKLRRPGVPSAPNSLVRIRVCACVCVYIIYALVFNLRRYSFSARGNRVRARTLAHLDRARRFPVQFIIGNIYIYERPCTAEFMARRVTTPTVRGPPHDGTSRDKRRRRRVRVPVHPLPHLTTGLFVRSLPRRWLR